jgi:RimJ/RimL family protein N-acetyltransferase
VQSPTGKTQEGLFFLMLTVTIGNERVRALYLAVGFRAVTREPRYLKIGEEYFDIEWMHLRVNREQSDSEETS